MCICISEAIEAYGLYRRCYSRYNLSTMLSSDENLLDLLACVSAVVSQQGCTAYLVGGCVRDWLSGRETTDIDLAVDRDPQNIASHVAAAIGGKSILLDDVNRVFRVLVERNGKQWHLDFTCFQQGIEEDLARRDFTVNAMAIGLQDFVSGNFARPIDPFSGERDLNARIIRAVSSDVFQKDAARLLRAVRLAQELKFTIEPDTEELIRKNCRLVVSVPGERVREELLRMLALPGSADLLRYIDRLGLLTSLIPELEHMRGVEQPKEHYWDVLEHSLETVGTIEFVLRESTWRYGSIELLVVTPWSEELMEHFDAEVAHGSTRRVLLKLGGLLHDIAKPATKTVDGGRVRFLGHTKQGAAMAAAIMERLRFSNREVRFVESLVYHHLRPVQMANGGLPTSRAIYRFFRDTEGAGIDILFLALADFLATRGPEVDMEEWKQHNHLVSYVLAEYQKQQNVVLPFKLIDGHDLIRIFGLKPGRLIGELLNEVREAQVAGEVTSREEALELVRRSLAKRQCGAAC